MEPRAFIRPVGTNTTYTLVKTINIKLKPSKTYFNFYNIRFSSWLKLNIPKSTFIYS
jgi:hypothetical protein